MDDRKLRQLVIDELEFEPSIDAAHIGVAAEKGVITLAGHVSSYAQKIAALHAVRRLKGVRGVALEIEVRYPNDNEVSDDELAMRVLNVLQWDAMIPKDAVKVVVQKGWVHLSGTLTWQFEKKAAEAVVKHLTGVLGVTNAIVITPTVEAAEVEKKIANALERHAQVEGKSIRVRVDQGNIVQLEGKVDSWEDHDLIENAAWSVPGVRWVNDSLRVSS